jgi:hypothetical protein
MFIKINYDGDGTKEWYEQKLKNLLDIFETLITNEFQKKDNISTYFKKLLHHFKEGGFLNGSPFSVGSTLPNPVQTEKTEFHATKRHNVMNNESKNEIVLYILLSIVVILIVVKICGYPFDRSDIKNPSSEEHDIENPPPLTHNIHNIENNTDNLPTEHSDTTLDNSDSGSILENSNFVLENSDSILENSDSVLENSDSVFN